MASSGFGTSRIKLSLMKSGGWGRPSHWLGPPMVSMSSSATRCLMLYLISNPCANRAQENKLHVLSPTEPNVISTHQQPTMTNDITFDWSGQRLFVTTGEGKIRILTFPGLEPAYQFSYKDPSEKEFMLSGHTSSCIAVELHPFNRYLATGGTDSLISLWETNEWNCVRTITKMTGPVRSICTHTSYHLV